MRTIRRAGNRGFTLIEILIVLALIGILAVILVPNFLTIIARAKTVGFARSSEAFANFSRLRAIRGGRPVHLAFEVELDPRGNPVTFVRAREDTDADGFGDNLVNQEVMPSTIRLAAPGGLDVIAGQLEVLEGTAVAPIKAQIVFNPDGSVQRTGSIRWADQRNNFMELAVGPSRAIGRISVQKWDGSAYRQQGEDGEWKWS